MSRYSKTRTTKMKHSQGSVRNKESIKFQTTIYENVPERDDDIYIITQPGDRLENLAHRFYGDSSKWWIIARGNNIRDGSFGLEPEEHQPSGTCNFSRIDSSILS